jgi:hypothetical protein
VTLPPDALRRTAVTADPLAAVAADESLPAGVRSAAAQLTLIDLAKENGASWAVIGAALGISGREAKKRAHGMRVKVVAAAIAAGPQREEGSDE